MLTQVTQDSTMKVAENKSMSYGEKNRTTVIQRELMITLVSD